MFCLDLSGRWNCDHSGKSGFMRQLFTFLHTPEDLMTETLQYFGTILAGTTITIFNNLP